MIRTNIDRLAILVRESEQLRRGPTEQNRRHLVTTARITLRHLALHAMEIEHATLAGYVKDISAVIVKINQFFTPEDNDSVHQCFMILNEVLYHPPEWTVDDDAAAYTLARVAKG